ncbi:MAG TPA: GAF domain-containing protein [Anaerolineales bacterium]|nr:GAF domain-containing protein [Anaerolineales bacterium]
MSEDQIPVLAALRESMRAVYQAVAASPDFPPAQFMARLEEWQQMLDELDRYVTTEGRTSTEQLATLFEISTSLNASLDIDETLNRVMDSLIQLTGAERGCLMLVDDNGQLNIEIAHNFDRGEELDLSRTVLRIAVEQRQPVLTTNAQMDPRFSAQESVIGYGLRSIICVPLQMRERVIGALYLDNRIKTGVFSKEDVALLTAFANHAAVAIENARLYTATDRTLAVRVRELTTMQQIDRELNASLDIHRVLELTLSWAMRATGADAGTLRLLGDEGKPTITVQKGEIPNQIPSPNGAQVTIGRDEPAMFNGNRIVTPIRYKGETIGLMELWRKGERGFSEDHTQFVGRLVDHAAIAIANARLYEQVRQANLAKSEFVSLVAHELRTPMTSIRGYADMLLKEMVGPLNDQQKQFLQTIRSNVERMRILVSDLQDISRIETGRLRLEIQPTSLADALREALRTVQGQIEAKGQHLSIQVPGDLPTVQADPSRLAQVMTNLLSNAHKYTPEGGQIEVRAWTDGRFVRCAVSDTGIGISPEDQERLFTKFFRADNPIVRDQPGTGLGLCIVKNLVELQGGEIEVESAVGEGTTFTFSIPIAEGWSTDKARQVLRQTVGR